MEDIANVGFAEIEVTPDEILIRRSGSGTLAPELLDAVYAILLDAADQLANARSGWDGEDVDGEMAFFSATATVSEALRTAVERARRDQRSIRKMIPSGK